MKRYNFIKPASLSIAMLSAFPVSASIIINEIDYDQPGADNAEFIELYNNGPDPLSLDGFYIDLINGSNDSVYNTIQLDSYAIASSGYFVVCSDASLVANCNYDLNRQSGWIQNGSPDAIALYDATGLLDSLAYEDEMIPYTETSVPADTDSNTLITSLSRIPDGFDTNDNGRDFVRGCITPGSANIPGTGDCSTLSAVPVPASIWLLGSGMIGLVGMARSKT